MRRGLIAWSEDEVPRAVLDARVARLQSAMAGDGLGAVLVYTNFPRPAAVSWLTHFVPYWSQGLLAVFPDGAPVLFVSLSRRVGGWIERTSHIGEVVCTPAIGKMAAARIAERAGPTARIGIVELPRLPGGIGLALQKDLAGATLTDAASLFAGVRHPADDAEIVLSRRAAEMARVAFDETDISGCTVAGQAVAALESAIRLAGAEDVLINVVPDLSVDARLQRMEGDTPLGERFAIRLSVAYKGHWVRLSRSFARNGAGEALDGWLSGSLKAPSPLATLEETAHPRTGMRLETTVAEACTGTAPLTQTGAPPPGAVVSLTLTLADEAGGYWLAGAPALTPGEGDGGWQPI